MQQAEGVPEPVQLLESPGWAAPVKVHVNEVAEVSPGWTERP